MGRSSGVMTTVKVPVKWEVMTDRQKTRLSRITSRDTRVIKAYLGVIEKHERDLLVGNNKKRLDAGKIDELTLRTDTRTVPHDFKDRFPNISTNELQECRETAIAMWRVYLALGRNKPLQATGYRSKKLPRHMFTRMFKFTYTPEKEIKHWLTLRDSLDSVREGRKTHDRLAMPLSPSSYHLNRLRSGETKSIQIVKDKNRKWWVLFKVKLNTESSDDKPKPSAVIGIDLGIKKAVCSAVLTQKGLRHVRFWTDREKARHIERYDRMVASLQQKRDTSLHSDEVTKRLRAISAKRENISFDYDRVLVKKLAEHIIDLSQEYNLYISIGKLKGIRNRARKGDGKGRRFRGMINRWSFARITNSLQHKLSMSGFDPKRVHAVSEAWTSIKCHKCGSKGFRPKQSYFLCHTCGYRDNADKNAAINIALRLIRLIPSLRDEKGLGTWFSKWKTSPKTPRTLSKGMSSVPKKMPASIVGSSVADCTDQTSPEEFVSSTDQAMPKTMEEPSAIMESGDHDSIVQRSEAMSVKRSHAPVTHSKPRAHPAGEVLLVAGDSSQEEG